MAVQEQAEATSLIPPDETIDLDEVPPSPPSPTVEPVPETPAPVDEPSARVDAPTRPVGSPSRRHRDAHSGHVTEIRSPGQDAEPEDEPESSELPGHWQDFVRAQLANIGISFYR